jgi:PKD repeat protein
MDDRGASATNSVAVAVSPPNQPPNAALTVTPPSGTAPLAVTADASASSDPDGTITTYRFDFGDGTVAGPQPGATATHTYAAGSWTATVEVMDNAGASATKSVAVSVDPGEVNFVGNPSFETGTEGWAAIGGASITRVPGGSAGDFSLAVSSPTVGTAPYGITDQPNWVTATSGAGVRYRVRAWVRAELGASLVSLRLRESPGGAAGSWVESAGSRSRPRGSRSS